MQEILIYAGIILFAVIILFKVILGIRIIPNNKVAVIEKWWSGKGSLKEEIIALNGEAGFQPDLIRGGIHFLSPLKYKVHICPLVTIPQGQIGYVFARDGKPLEPTQTLGKVIPESNNFQDVRGFITNGGQKGPQRAIIREGTYAFNLAQFIIMTESKIYYLPTGNRTEDETINRMVTTLNSNSGFTPIIISGSDDKIGVVTVHDGPSLGKDDVIAPTVGNDVSNPETYHNNFQDIEKFLKAGGFRGRQYQVLVDGTYFINRLFASVEPVDKTIIDVGYVGVVVSYIGEKGEDQSGKDYKHGELVNKGCRGVWSTALMPGKYAFNTYAGKIIRVPTTNIILKWINNQFGAHRYDENLKEVSLITKDAFEPSLPLSVVLHIDYQKAPLVIQRFGDIKMLVDQTLDPMVSAYFKNIGQGKTLIQLLQERNEIQKIASSEMKERFEHYNLELEEVLIGTPASSDNDNKIEVILTQLRDRQVATEQIETYARQQESALKERELKEAQAKTSKQKDLTESEINIEIESNKGKAEYHKSLQDAEKIKVLANADAEKIEVIANADGKKEAIIGIGKAMAIEEQVKAYGGSQFKIIESIVDKYTNAIKEGHIQIVPNTVVNMSNNENNYDPLQSLIALTISEKLGVNLKNDTTPKSENEEVKAIKEGIRKSLKNTEGTSDKKNTSDKK